MTEPLSESGADKPPQPPIDTTVPHTARIWNYWLGGKDNYAIDRQVGDQITAVYPQAVDTARASRAFLVRAVRYLAGEAGIRQFLDIGTGLPTANNTHEIAQLIAPECRIVYVDNDPLVLVHARALLTSDPRGATDYLDADLRDTATILQKAAGTLESSQPVALMLLGILGHVSSYEDARTIVRALAAELPSGSYLVIADGEDSNQDALVAEQIWNDSAALPYHFRSRAEIAGYFDGWELVEPGLVDVGSWRPEPGQPGAGQRLTDLVGVARKP